MRRLNSSLVLVSSLALLSCSNAVVEAFNFSPPGSSVSQRQIVEGRTADTPTKLDAASLVISFEEDLMLTRQIILDHQERSVTVSKEQFVQQMEEIVKPAEVAEIAAETVDISVPYDAAARLAYESLEDKSGISFDIFRAQYLADAVAYVKSKQPKKEMDATISETQTTTTDTTTSKKSRFRRVVSWVGNKMSKN